MDYVIKMNYRFNGELTDSQFNENIRSVIDYVEKQITNKKPTIEFKQYADYSKTRENLMYYLKQYNSYYHDVTKYILVMNTVDMISYMPTPHMRKEAMNYLNSQIALYCYNKRPYTNQIPNYPYKSKNITDLLEEVEQVNQERTASGLFRRCHCK